MAKYRANFNVNNGTHFIHDLTSTNKFSLWRSIKESVRAQIFPGSNGSCWVEDEFGKTVFEAYAYCPHDGYKSAVLRTYIYNYEPLW